MWWGVAFDCLLLIMLDVGRSSVEFFFSVFCFLLIDHVECSEKSCWNVIRWSC